MCGIVALWNIPEPDLARAMTEKIAHRGPDALNVTAAPSSPAVLGHCRLAIIGPEDGRQPIVQGAAALVANGEIYNHEDLRAVLGSGAFVTQSDSEAILHVAASTRRRWVDQLDGMFAFFPADGARFVAGRDPLGIKPLFRARRGQGLAFASEVKAFDGHGFEDVSPVPPGSVVDDAGRIRRWWRVPQGAAAMAPDDDVEDIARGLRLVLEDAVRKWMTSDVEVGSFLSGGLDSSIIAALATRFARGRLKTFSVGVAGSPDLVAAAKVAAHIGSEHHELAFTAEDLAGALPHVIYHLESADVDLVRSALPTHFATALAARHVKVVLTGEGADELFAGYTYHRGYAGQPRALADELTRSLTAMHNINLQRVDRITMAKGLEARTPFLDRDLIAFAQSIPASLKLSQERGRPVEKWILRKACQDLLPDDLVWRDKAQFDEGSGVVDALDRALGLAAGNTGAVDRDQEGRLYRQLIEDAFIEPEIVFATAGTWTSDRVPA
ncbi:MAG: asparagine synthase-related protein [Geminicoccaceae bacterium]|nr:asparagine synthase-related protein [Geminicoccaceae bacterium]